MTEGEAVSLKSDKPPFFYGYIVVGASFLAMLLMGGTFYTFGVFFKPILEEFGWTRATLSGAFSLNAFLYGLFGIVAGRLADRFGPRVMVSVAGLIWGVGYFLMAQMNDVWQMYLFYGVMISTGMAAVYVPSMSITMRWFARRRGMMAGIIQGGVSMGGFVVPPLVSMLIIAYDWRTAAVVMGAATLLSVVVAAQFMRREPAEMREYRHEASPADNGNTVSTATGFSLYEASRTQQFWIVLMVLFIGFFCVDSIVVHIVPYVTDLRYSANIAATVLAVMSGLSFVGKLAVGIASDRIGNKLALAVSLSLMSVALFWLLVSKQLWGLYLFAAAFGFGYGGLASLQSPLIASLFGLKALGVILGVVVFGGTLGTVTGPLMAGYLFDIKSSYDTAFLLCALISTVGLALTLFLKPTGIRN